MLRLRSRRWRQRRTRRSSDASHPREAQAAPSRPAIGLPKRVPVRRRARRSSTPRRRRASNRRRASGVTRARIMSTEFVVPSPIGTFVSFIRTCRTITARGWICSGRSTTAAEPMLSSAPRGRRRRQRRPTSRPRRPTFGWRWRAAFWALVTADAAFDVLEQSVARAQAQVRDVREHFACGTGATERGGVCRSTGITAADAAHRSRRPSGSVVGGAGPARRRRRRRGARRRGELEAAPSRRAAGRRAGSRWREARAAERTSPCSSASTRLSSVHGGSRSRRPSVCPWPAASITRGPNPRIFPRTDQWDDSWDAGINVSWSFWDGGRTRAEAAQAVGHHGARARAAGRVRLGARARGPPASARDRLRPAAVAAADDAVRAATEAQRVVSERYRAGVITQIEVLDAEVALLQAELDRTRALASVRLAEARLARALGR